MAHGLPTTVLLKSPSSNKYLRYVSDELDIHKFLQFSGEKALSPDSMFELEIPKSAKAAEMGLVHIRSTYNNRYWQRWSNITNWIVATADEPEEDPLKWSCTLFQPTIVAGGHEDSKTTIRLGHVQLERCVSVSRHAGKPYESCLYVGSSGEADDDDGASIFEVVNRQSLVALPEYLTFKGKNGNYLNARSINNSNILEFASSDLGDPYVMHRVIDAGDGTRVRFKSTHFHKFWRYNSRDNYISADSDDTTDDGDANTLFSPVKLNHNHVALLNMGNYGFAKRFSYYNRLHYLAAVGSTTSDEETNLEVLEVVASREINNVQFRLLDARIYNKKVIIKFTQKVTNTGSTPLTSEIKLSHTESKTSNWDYYYHSLKLGVEVKLSSGAPCIESGEIVVQDEFEGSYKWGELMTSTADTEFAETITVPPRTKVKVSLIATQGTYDVPFSYTQHDTLYNGERVTYKKSDGIYTGTNNYTFKLDTQEEPL